MMKHISVTEYAEKWGVACFVLKRCFERLFCSEVSFTENFDPLVERKNMTLGFLHSSKIISFASNKGMLMKLKEIFVYFTDTIFRRDESHWRNPVVRWLVKQYKLFFYTARGVIEHDTFVRSAALTFYTLMSLVPIVAVLFAVVKGFGLGDRLIENLYELFPHSQVVALIIDFADKALLRIRGGLVAAVALVTLLWAVVRVFASIESAFNNIWEVKRTRNIARQYTDYIAVLFIVPVLWIGANAIGGFLRSLMADYIDLWYFMLLSRLVSMMVIWLMFSLLYMIIPNTKVYFRSAFRAAVISGTLFISFQWGYFYLQQWMTSYNAIYGSFVALPLLLVWMQTSWQLFLFGGELSFAYQNIVRFDEERESLLVSYSKRRRILLAVMLHVVRHYVREGGAVTADELIRSLKLPTRIINDVLFQLVKTKQLIALPDEHDERQMRYVPAYAPSTMTLYGVIRGIETAQDADFKLPDVADLNIIDRELSRLNHEYGEEHKRVRLIDIM